MRCPSDGPRVPDCLAFDDRLRHGDVLGDPRDRAPAGGRRGDEWWRSIAAGPRPAPRPRSDPLAPRTTHDAVVVIPGFLGSRLEKEGRLVWGMRPRRLSDALWFRLFTLRADAWREGIDDGIRPTGLLNAYAHIPGVASIAPYGDALAALRPVVADPAAILPFPYDWRLSARHNARLLADACTDHLARWRAHRRGDPQAGLRFVCHSMGGIIALEFCAHHMGSRETRQIVTLGTPFGGTVKAVGALGRSDLLPFGPGAERLRKTLASFPAMYELLARTECLAEGDRLRRPGQADFAMLGIAPDLTSDALGFRRQLSAHLPDVLQCVHVRAIAGNGQPTPSTFRIVDGRAELTAARSGSMGDGDGTVPIGAAHLAGVETVQFAQRHVALAADPAALGQVARWLVGTDVARGMGTPGVGLETPEAAARGRRFTVIVHAAPRREVSVTVIDLATDRTIQRESLPIGRAEGPCVVVLTAPLNPGLIKVEVRADGPPVYELILVE